LFFFPRRLNISFCQKRTDQGMHRKKTKKREEMGKRKQLPKLLGKLNNFFSSAVILDGIGMENCWGSTNSLVYFSHSSRTTAGAIHQKKKLQKHFCLIYDLINPVSFAAGCPC